MPATTGGTELRRRAGQWALQDGPPPGGGTPGCFIEITRGESSGCRARGTDTSRPRQEPMGRTGLEQPGSRRGRVQPGREEGA